MRGLLAAHWPVLLGWMAVLSLIAFCLMWADKRRARRGAWRVPERCFFLLAVLGGAPGAIAGMWVFHHKTRHWYFKLGLPFILLAQAVLLAFACSRWP